MNGFIRFGSNATKRPCGRRIRNTSPAQRDGSGKWWATPLNRTPSKPAFANGRTPALATPLQDFYAGMLAPTDRDELPADVEAGALVACAAQEMRKSAGTAAEIDDSRTGAEPAQLDECINEARARLRREYVVLVRIGMGIEEGNLALLVLLRTVPHACFRAH